VIRLPQTISSRITPFPSSSPASMRKDSNRGDLEYGYSSFEQGIKYGLTTKCSYFELLKYTDSTGTAVHSSTGEIDDASFGEWLSKVLLCSQLLRVVLTRIGCYQTEIRFGRNEPNLHWWPQTLVSAYKNQRLRIDLTLQAWRVYFRSRVGIREWLSYPPIHRREVQYHL
jgi:hypothetical protein